MYDPIHHIGPGPLPHFLYPQNMIGPGQPPPPMMQAYVHQDQRPVYYPVIDPNIDAGSRAGSSKAPVRTPGQTVAQATR